MNETEAEAHRLLAAATEDMPPGIDLLAGFAPAWRRDRARRRRGRAAVSAGVAVTAAAVAAVALTIGSAPPARATLTSALTSTLAQSYHLTWTTGGYYIWSGGRTTSTGQLICTSEADPVRQLEASSCSNGLQNREVGGYMYLYFPDMLGHPGKHWQRQPAASIGDWGAINGFLTATPQQMLSQIKQATKVTVVGPVSGPGWTGTRYAFSWGPAARQQMNGTVDVDLQGQARAVGLTMRLTTPNDVLVTTYVLTFSDFGAPVTVTPPPADQTYIPDQAPLDTP
jgi:hypothetical protein